MFMFHEMQYLKCWDKSALTWEASAISQFLTKMQDKKCPYLTVVLSPAAQVWLACVMWCSVTHVPHRVCFIPRNRGWVPWRNLQTLVESSKAYHWFERYPVQHQMEGLIPYLSNVDPLVTAGNGMFFETKPHHIINKNFTQSADESTIYLQLKMVQKLVRKYCPHWRSNPPGRMTSKIMWASDMLHFTILKYVSTLGPSGCLLWQSS